VLYTWAGPEIAVASTKAYSVQCALLYLFAIKLAMIGRTLSEDKAKLYCASILTELPSLIEETLKLDEDISKIAFELTNTEHAFYIGRDIDKDVCIEASLKLKEISYIHSEAYPAGELKHGTISLITEGTPVIALVTSEKICEKTISGIREVKARGAKVILVVSKKLDSRFDIPYDRKLVLPDTDAELLLPFSATTVMQLLAYHVSFLLGLDVDKPRNLAKSVTVE
jgi:glucosamine--fructose-6-phosphate aminotransferase (isomerizing)